MGVKYRNIHQLSHESKMTRGNKYIFKSDNTATYIILKFLLLLSLYIGIYMFRVLGVRYRNINQLSHESKITRVNKYIFKSVYTATYIILLFYYC